MEEDKKLIKESLSSVMPQIAYLEELRELVGKEFEGCDCIKSFAEKFKRKISEGRDTTKRTDGQIFLNELRRNLSKSSSD